MDRIGHVDFRRAGCGGNLADGGIYDPSTDAWSPMSTAGAPSPRYNHVAVWTGSKMIGLGWVDVADPKRSTRAEFSTPARTPDGDCDGGCAGAACGAATAVWTGARMVVWGGADNNNAYVNTGAATTRIRTSGNRRPPVNAPTARAGHVGVWSGSKTIVWGGFGTGGKVNTGGLYDPAADSDRNAHRRRSLPRSNPSVV